MVIIKRLLEVLSETRNDDNNKLYSIHMLRLPDMVNASRSGKSRMKFDVINREVRMSLSQYDSIQRVIQKFGIAYAHHFLDLQEKTFTVAYTTCHCEYDEEINDEDDDELIRGITLNYNCPIIRITEVPQGN